MGVEADEAGRNGERIELDSLLEASKTPSCWPQEFERQQKLILEFWQSCNVSLVHRTYFFLLFKEWIPFIWRSSLEDLRSSSKHFLEGYRRWSDSHTCFKALRREREMLIKLMQRRFPEDERNRLYTKWGIGSDSKRRRLQLVNHLWSNTNDMNQVTESAAIVAKLAKFSREWTGYQGDVWALASHPTLEAEIIWMEETQPDSPDVSLVIQTSWEHAI